MPGPRVIVEAGTLQLNVRAALGCLRLPANTKKGSVYAVCFTARPLAHKNRIDFGGFLASWVRSAMTRKARAVTSTSASCFVLPYAITPGKAGTSASQRPSSSSSYSIRKDWDSPSGGCSTVAMETPGVDDGIRRRREYCPAES